MRWILVVLSAVTVWGCTSRYRELLQTREQEIVGLRDALERLEAESRVRRTREDALKERVRALEAELARVRARAKRAPRAATEPEEADRAALVKVARVHGLSVRKRPDGFALVLPAAVTFRPGSASLTAAGRKVLDGVAPLLRRLEGRYVLSIEGHTDATPIRKSRFGTNWRLSAERAEAVRAYLFRRGVGRRGPVRVVGYGATRPVAGNARAADRQRNRRVEIVLLKA